MYCNLPIVDDSLTLSSFFSSTKVFFLLIEHQTFTNQLNDLLYICTDWIRKSTITDTLVVFSLWLVLQFCIWRMDGFCFLMTQFSFHICPFCLFCLFVYFFYSFFFIYLLIRRFALMCICKSRLFVTYNIYFFYIVADFMHISFFISPPALFFLSLVSVRCAHSISLKNKII